MVPLRCRRAGHGASMLGVAFKFRITNNGFGGK